MLMNGIGLVGTPERLALFFSHPRQLVSSAGGQLLCDSVDVFATPAGEHAAYREANISRGISPGQQRLQIEFDGERGEPFDWLHIDFHLLSEIAKAAGWSCQTLAQHSDGRYVAKMQLLGD